MNGSILHDVETIKKQSTKETITSLLRFGIGHSPYFKIEDVDWSDVEAFAKSQGLSAIMLDGIRRLPDEKKPDQSILSKIEEDAAERIEPLVMMGEKPRQQQSACGEVILIIQQFAKLFISEKITFRHILEWAYYVENHQKEIDWSQLQTDLDKKHLRDFFNCLNAICVEDLGFPSEIFHVVQFVPEQKERILDEMFSWGYLDLSSKGIIARCLRNFYCWKTRGRRYKLCYR